MDRRPENQMPPGPSKGYFPSALPPHINNQAYHASTGSTDSIRTQLPLPYHLNGSEGLSPGLDGGFFHTPELPSHGQFQSFANGHGGPQLQRGVSGPLNPNSAPYIPPSPSFASQYSPEGFEARNLGSHSFGMPLPNVGMDYYGQHQHQNGYGGMDMSSVVSSPQLGPVHDAYAHYMGSNGANGYQQAQYGSINQQVAPQNQYNMAAPPGFGHGMNGMNGTNNMSYGQHANQQYGNDGYGGPPQIQYPVQYPPQQRQPGMNGQGDAPWVQGYGYVAPPVEHPYVTSSNLNRGKPASQPQFRSNTNSVRSISNNRSMNNSSAGSNKWGNKRKNKGKNGMNGSQAGYNSTQSEQGKDPFPPPTAKATNGNMIGRAASTLSKMSLDTPSSLDYGSHHGQVIETDLSRSVTMSEDDTKSISDLGSPTPGPRLRKAVDFAADLRGTQTPTLRSRRGQTIQAPSTDPTHNKMAEWLNKLPPPKMESLTEMVASTYEDDKFKSPNGYDVFSSGFATPYRGGAVRGPYAQNGNVTPARHVAIIKQTDLSTRMSPALMNLTKGGQGRPSVEEALDLSNIPFVEYCRRSPIAKVEEFGVVKLLNIPYGVNRPEVLAFLGRNARVIDEKEYEPVHIVMERVTSKTLDCYIEFINLNEAVSAVNRYEGNRTNGRNGRLGQRHIDMEVSSQEALMADLFPKAKNVRWTRNGVVVLPTDPTDQFNSGFSGFISKEEIIMLVKHVEAPQRSPFSKECPQRPYECMISTLYKYPWHMVDYITIEDRELLFDASLTLLTCLKQRIDERAANPPPPPPPGERDTDFGLALNNSLLQRLIQAAMRCVGFTPTMKDTIAFKFDVHEEKAQELGVPLFAADWKYLWSIGPKPGVPHDLILWYAAIIRESTVQRDQSLSLAERAVKGVQDEGPKLFGDLEKFIAHPKDFAEFQTMTLAQAGRREWIGIENALRRALTGRLEDSISA